MVSAVGSESPIPKLKWALNGLRSTPNWITEISNQNSFCEFAAFDSRAARGKHRLYSNASIEHGDKVNDLVPTEQKCMPGLRSQQSCISTIVITVMCTSAEKPGSAEL